jgi:hypothetical protein
MGKFRLFLSVMAVLLVCILISSPFVFAQKGKGAGAGTSSGGKGLGRAVQARLDLNHHVDWYKRVPPLKLKVPSSESASSGSYGGTIETKTITFLEFSKMHGHVCYSSCKIYRVLQEGIKAIYGGRAPDRDDVEVLVGANSPCVRDCVWKTFNIEKRGEGMRNVKGIRGREYIIQSKSKKKAVLVEYVAEPSELKALSGTTPHTKKGKKLREKLFKRQLLGPLKGLILSIKKKRYRSQ